MVKRFGANSIKYSTSLEGDQYDQLLPRSNKWWPQARCHHCCLPYIHYPATVSELQTKFEFCKLNFQLADEPNLTSLIQLALDTVTSTPCPEKNGPPKHVQITLWIEDVSDYFSMCHEKLSICNVCVKFHDN